MSGIQAILAETRASILSGQATRKAASPSVGAAGYSAWRVPFDEARRGQFPARRRRDPGCGAETATP
jgi:hypothetical protein